MIEAMPPGLTTSAARDATAGRPTELDAIVGSLVRAAARADVPAPSLEALLADAEKAASVR
jgi:2-dehydropantoate 2-reductase